VFGPPHEAGLPTGVGTADLIKGNKVSSCKPNGYGVFVFATVASSVKGNKIKGCAVGLAVFGSQPGTTSVGPTFANNTVNGAGASTTEPGGTVGANITTDLVGFEFGNATGTLTHNRLEGFGTGLIVTQSKPTNGDNAGGQATVTAHNNSIAKNGAGANGETGTVLEAQNNWWGCTQGPNMNPKCDSAVGTTQFTPWLTSKP
jgi:hypothetical protein